MSEPNDEALAKLTAMYKDMFDAEERAIAARKNVQLAQQSLLGAETDALAKQARFKGAAELIYGADWGYEYKDGKLKFIPPALAQKQAATHGPLAHGRGKRRR